MLIIIKIPNFDIDNIDNFKKILFGANLFYKFFIKLEAQLK